MTSAGLFGRKSDEVVGSTSTYKGYFGFSVFVNRLKNQIVSEGPKKMGSNERKCCRDGLGTKKRSVVSDIVGGFC